ncbi:MAG: hypothetical protein AAF311_10425 [Pseudomonadota bacterium]
MAALKQAAAGGHAIWAMIGAACWVGTACLTFIALQDRPLVFVSVVSTGLSVSAAILIGHLAYGEPLRPAHLIALVLLFAAIVLNAVTT